jgi:hypothetical protein
LVARTFLNAGVSTLVKHTPMTTHLRSSFDIDVVVLPLAISPLLIYKMKLLVNQQLPGLLYDLNIINTS